MNTKKKGKILELITLMLECALSEVPQTKIYPNKKIKDKDGIYREIDVYIESVLNEKNIKIAIECKNFGPKSYVKMEHIEAYFGKLSRLPDEIKGIYLTTGKYQKNALKKAKTFNIETYKINLQNTPIVEERIDSLRKVRVTNYLAKTLKNEELNNSHFSKIIFNGKKINALDFINNELKPSIKESMIKENAYNVFYTKKDYIETNTVKSIMLYAPVKNVFVLKGKEKIEIKEFWLKIDYWIEISKTLNPFTSKYFDLNSGELFANFFTLISDVQNKLNLMAFIKTKHSNKIKLVIVTDKMEKMIADVDNFEIK